MVEMGEDGGNGRNEKDAWRKGVLGLRYDVVMRRGAWRAVVACE